MIHLGKSIGKSNRIRILFYLLWVLALSLQAYFTELIPDEAYYWCYSRALSWGYFDHPPVIAWLIKGGSLLLSGELGVRLIPIIMSVLTIWCLEKLIRPDNLKLFFALIASVGILHFIGFLAIPDSPLICMLAVYLCLYRRFIAGVSLKYALLLGVAMAILMMSKYHGIIVVGLTVISNPKLLGNKFFWLAVLTSMILLMPHLLWQIAADFPSLRYHLFERSIALYHPEFTLEYLVASLFVLGPFTGILFFLAAIRLKSATPFEKTLKYIFWGTYIFFFLMSFKGRVEAHWTLVAILPALYFGYHQLLQMKRYKHLLVSLFCVSVVLIVAARVLVVHHIVKDNNTPLAQLTRAFRNKDDMLAIKLQAGGIPVAFMNGYQKASLYSFYSGSDGFSLNNIMGRKNQYDLWHVEEKYRKRKIMLIPNYRINGLPIIQCTSDSAQYMFIDNFQSFSKVRITAELSMSEIGLSDTLNAVITLFNTLNDTVDFSANPDDPSYLVCHFFKGRQVIKEATVFKIDNSMLNRAIPCRIAAPDLAGTYQLVFSIRTGCLPPTINSSRYKISVEDTGKLL